MRRAPRSPPLLPDPVVSPTSRGGSGGPFTLRRPEAAVATDSSGRFVIPGKTGFKMITLSKEPEHGLRVCIVVGGDLLYSGSLSYMGLTKHPHLSILCDIASESSRGKCEFVGEVPEAY